MKIVTLDIGGTSIKAGEYADGKIQYVKEIATEAAKGGEHVMDRAKDIIRTYSGFDRIGISTAGQVDSLRGRIRYANSNIPGYTGMEVRSIMETEFHVPVAVENDVNAAAFGEAMFGAGKDVSDFLCLTYGTGVGGAIVMNRKIYTGHQFSAGEFGGMIVHASERNCKEDIFSGCYERYASATALVNRALEVDASLVSGREIFARIEEQKIRNIVDAWICEIVYGLITLIHMFNPSLIVLGGGVMKQKYILEKINEILYNHIMDSFCNVVVRQAELGNMAGLLGAAKMAESIE